MATITQDNKTTTTLTAESRTAVGTITQNARTTSGNLWSSTIFPWTLNFPWQWVGNGQVITLDART